MKKRVSLLFLSCLLLILSAAGFGWAKARNAAPVPRPSRPGGYYDAPFTLTLSVPGNGRIYYTTDGSVPTKHSPVYDGGIEIYDRTPEPNLCNSVQNVIPDWQSYTPDPAPVPKGTVIRALFVNDRGIESEILTQTYFVGIRPPEQGYTLCLAFDHGDMFGKNGIHVTGEAYDGWYLSGGEGPAPQVNFQQELEIPAAAEFLNDEGEYLSQQVGLRLQGASARMAPKKRLILTARPEYGGSLVFDKPLFDGIASHSVMIKDALADAMIPDLIADRDVAFQRSVPVRVYLNGEFWYDSFLLERYDEQYFRQHYGVDDRIRVKNGIPDEESAATDMARCYTDFMGWVGDTDFSGPGGVDWMEAKASVQSFIDYVTVNYYLCNADLDDQKNYVLWRSPYEGSGQYQDGRWRWCIYDIDDIGSIAPQYPYPDTVARLNTFSSDHSHELNSLTLLRALRENEEFRRRFVLSFMDMVNNNFAPDNVEPVLKKYGYDLGWMDNFFLERPKYAPQHLAQEFRLTGTLETVTVSANDPAMGTVTVNTSRINLENGPWSGRYFTDYPITVTAVPNPGYRFAGWKGGTAASSLTLSVEGGLSLEAVFETEK